MSLSAFPPRPWLSGAFFPMLLILFFLFLNFFDSDFFRISHHSQQDTGIHRFYPQRLKLNQLDKKTLVPFEISDDRKNYSGISREYSLRKRDDERHYYDEYVCKGNRALEIIRTRAPSNRVYTRQDQLDAWAVTPKVGGVVRELVPALFALGVPTKKEDAMEVVSSQSKEVQGANGQNYRATNGFFDNVFIPNGDRGMIIAKNNHSPAHYKRADHPLPNLHRWSDVVWQNWTAITGDDVNARRGLRFILRQHVWTESVRRLLEYIEVVEPDKLNLPYPGKVYDMRSDDGKALLGCPHGVGVAWLIADHSNVLGRKIPVVRVFTTPARLMRDLFDYHVLYELRDTVEGPG
ncbi:MAG: hypothetical protein LQ344_004596 [Seirophora lacunosa]|nr:MAG: hypothetical protein LQ344_004596 [Seirophora lacunosa]